jgi:hypothetical protein
MEVISSLHGQRVFHTASLAIGVDEDIERHSGHHVPFSEWFGMEFALLMFQARASRVRG